MATDLNWELYQKRIRRLADLEFNYDEKIFHNSKDKSGWNIDRYEAKLETEPPGEPLPNGAFAAAKSAIHLYQFPDPNLISAVFDPKKDLHDRDMLMFARFAGLTFEFGVRVTSVIDGLEKNQRDEQLRVWGYSYRTLKGHFEVGEIRFEVTKNLITGEVRFRINAYSKPDRIPNLLYRVGFKVFARPLQRYFAVSSIKRLKDMARTAMAKHRLDKTIH